MPPPPYSPIGRQSACVSLAYRFIVPVGTPHIYGITEAENADIIVGVYTAVAHGGSMNLPDPGTVPAGRRVWFKDESDNAGTYGFSITTAGGSIEGGGGTVDVDGGCVGYYSNGVDKWYQIDAVLGAVAVPLTLQSTGASTVILNLKLADGTFIGQVSEGVANSYTISLGSTAAQLNIYDTSVSFDSTVPISFGDIAGNGHSSKMVVDDTGRVSKLTSPGGVTSIGDPDGADGGHYAKLDDGAALFSVNTDIEATTVGTGFILASPNGSRWRIAVSNAGLLSAVPA